MRPPPISTLFPYTTLFRSVTPVKGVAASRIPGAYRSRLPTSRARRFGTENYDGLPKGGGPLIYHGGPVMHRTTTHDRRSEEHTSELQSHSELVCRLLLEKK